MHCYILLVLDCWYAPRYSVSLSVCWFVCLFFVCLFVCPSVCLSIYNCLSIIYIYILIIFILYSYVYTYVYFIYLSIYLLPKLTKKKEVRAATLHVFIQIIWQTDGRTRNRFDCNTSLCWFDAGQWTIHQAFFFCSVGGGVPSFVFSLLRIEIPQLMPFMFSPINCKPRFFGVPNMFRHTLIIWLVL